MSKIKGVFSLVGFLFKTMWEELRKKRTWVIVGFILWTYLIAWFNANYYMQSPVETWQPIIMPRYTVKPIKKLTVVTKIKAQEPKPMVVAKTEEEIVKGQKHGDILWKIYQLETQRGKTDFCRKIGTFGGFGVKNEKGEIHCYMTFKEAAERANYWFGTHYPSKTLVDALCTWNKGTKERPVGGYMNCWYYQQYLSL